MPKLMSFYIPAKKKIIKINKKRDVVNDDWLEKKESQMCITFIYSVLYTRNIFSTTFSQ
jgi:hypothetical protein